MSGPKASSYHVVSEEELRRREDERRSRQCDALATSLEQLNANLLDNDRIDVKSPSRKTHESLLRWEKELSDALEKAKKALELQRQHEQRCRLLEKEIRQISSNLSSADEFAITAPSMKSLADIENWEEELTSILKDAEAKSKRDAFFLSKQAEKKLKLTNVNLSQKGQSRIAEIRVARRMDWLQKLADSIGEINEDTLRESFALEATSLLDLEDADDFDKRSIDINTRVRAAKKVERTREHAREEVEKVSHLSSPEVQTIRQLAETATTAEDLSRIRQVVAGLLEDERRSLDEAYVRDAICESLAEMGYECVDGFEQTAFGPVALADKKPYDNYSVRIQINSANASILSRVVARETTTPSQDTAAEEAFCPEYHSLMRSLENKGIETELLREARPGQYPLDRTARTRGLNTTQRNRRQRINATSRERNA